MNITKGDWHPWDDYEEPLPVLNIPEPPCKSCTYWKPQRCYRGTEYDGVVLCTAPDMQHDFSCFRVLETEGDT